jgi:hypothetical protein
MVTSGLLSEVVAASELGSESGRSVLMDIGSSSWFVAVVLGIGLAYGLWQWSRRPRDPYTERIRDRAVKDLYDNPPRN